MNYALDNNVTLGSILNALRAGNKAEHIAKEIDGISQKPFLRALKEAGYVYSNKTPKGWHYIGEGAEPLNKSIFDYVKLSSSSVKMDSSKVNKPSQTVHKEFTLSNTEVACSNTDVIKNSSVVHPQFTQNEVSMIMEMLYEWQQKKVTKQNEEIEASDQIYERIKQLPKGDKTRKTIVIDKSIGERLDEYCEVERVNKSDVIHLALLDFLNTNGS